MGLDFCGERCIISHVICKSIRPRKLPEAGKNRTEERKMKKYNKVVLAYSGGLDTSIIIPWLKENYG